MSISVSDNLNFCFTEDRYLNNNLGHRLGTSADAVSAQVQIDGETRKKNMKILQAEIVRAATERNDLNDVLRKLGFAVDATRDSEGADNMLGAMKQRVDQQVLLTERKLKKLKELQKDIKVNHPDTRRENQLKKTARQKHFEVMSRSNTPQTVSEIPGSRYKFAGIKLADAKQLALKVALVAIPVYIILTAEMGRVCSSGQEEMSLKQCGSAILNSWFK